MRSKNSSLQDKRKTQNRVAGSAGCAFPLFLPQDTVNALSDFLGFFHFLIQCKIRWSCSFIRSLKTLQKTMYSLIILSLSLSYMTLAFISISISAPSKNSCDKDIVSGFLPLLPVLSHIIQVWVIKTYIHS